MFSTVFGIVGYIYGIYNPIYALIYDSDAVVARKMVVNRRATACGIGRRKLVGGRLSFMASGRRRTCAGMKKGTGG